MLSFLGSIALTVGLAWGLSLAGLTAMAVTWAVQEVRGHGPEGLSAQLSLAATLATAWAAAVIVVF